MINWFLQSKQFACNGCQKHFSRPDVLEAHRRRVHGASAAKGHQNTTARNSSTAQRSYHPCPQCPAQLASLHHYHRHLEAHRKRGEADGPISCPHCGKLFADRRKYTVHLKHHRKAKKYACSDCGLAFIQKEFLRRHQLTHSGEKPFACLLCPSTFRQHVHLKQHIRRIHQMQGRTSGQLQCSQCDREFLTSSELKNHLRYHQPASEARAFSCSMCHLAFVEKGHLDRHVRRIHTGIRRYLCPHAGCGKGFFEKYELNYHLKRRCRFLPKAVDSEQSPGSVTLSSVSTECSE